LDQLLEELVGDDGLGAEALGPAEDLLHQGAEFNGLLLAHLGEGAQGALQLARSYGPARDPFLSYQFMRAVKRRTRPATVAAPCPFRRMVTAVTWPACTSCQNSEY
jgi:hypothetical protein